MIVDRRGVGAQMVARYPTQPSPVPVDPIDQDNHHGHEDQSADDLFFSLTSSQMAKLFRAKKSLCGQPVTLTVNGTVFCWRAVLMDADDEEDDEESSTTESTNELILFSVIVALLLPVSHTSVPFTWHEGTFEDHLDLHQFLKEATASETKRGSSGDIREEVRSTSSASLSIRRVHISLARLCRVLEREEKRCHYVSEQANVFLKIRSEQQKKWELQKVVANSSISTQQGSNNPASASSSVISSSTTQTGRPRRSRHSRQQSIGDEILLHSKSTPTMKEEQGNEQDILELMLAAFQHGTDYLVDDSSRQHNGNLVRELVQVFHSLSRNDYEYPPTAAALLCERDGVVHINSHIAVPIEAASIRTSQSSLRPYFTLLFPHASPSELLRTFQSSGSAAPQRLQQLLKTVNPQKSLSEIAVDANLPLYTTMEIASYLVAHGACVPSPIVSRKSRLNCLHVEKIPQLALEFSQTFSNVNFFRLLGFLTSSQTLGEAMEQMTDLGDDQAAWLRECWPPFKSILETTNATNVAMTYTPDNQARQSSGGPNQQQQPKRPRHRWVDELEEFLYAMTVWLLSHRVLTLTQEYLVLDGSVLAGEPPPIPPKNRSMTDTDEQFFQELTKLDFLNGDISIMALSWRLGLDQKKVRSWGYRYHKVRVMSRIPAPGDDWELELS
ncbi:unnamed protein product [Cylindrotheca closterium]|uniref:Uncharacterized protein n=1 Tax=Cylindrotheca closterium TaxID=2856 RepID=A0AAD2CTG3_9STRA|nr:unnamed protein product [Cylindrotheca closterium]